LADVELAEKQRLTNEVIVTIPKNLVLNMAINSIIIRLQMIMADEINNNNNNNINNNNNMAIKYRKIWQDK
jgi:hypothetical protein